jgi:ribosomal protein L37AE/L43A
MNNMDETEDELNELMEDVLSTFPDPECPACGWAGAEHRGPSMLHCSECGHEWTA